MPKDDLQVMRDLMEAQREGFALPRHFYTSQAVYENDISTFWNRNWIWVGHVSQVAEPGDYSCSITARSPSLSFGIAKARCARI